VYKAAGHDQGFLTLVAIVAMAFFTVIIYSAGSTDVFVS